MNEFIVGSRMCSWSVNIGLYATSTLYRPYLAKLKLLKYVVLKMWNGNSSKNNPIDGSSVEHVLFSPCAILTGTSSVYGAHYLPWPHKGPTHLWCVSVCFSNHSHEVGIKDHPAPRHSHLLSSRPDLAFHASMYTQHLYLCQIPGPLTYSQLIRSI